MHGMRNADWQMGRRATLVTLGGLVLLCAGGGDCDRRRNVSDYEVLHGTVTALRADTFDFTVAADNRWTANASPEPVSCLLTNDAEIYVNDKFSDFQEIAIGDAVELVGYRELNPRSERFVVSLANITRNEPLAPPPDLTTQPTAATTQPEEDGT